MRVFIAIDLPHDVRRDAAKAGAELLQVARGFRVPREANLHVTLLFLGEVEESLIPALTDSLRQALLGVDPFDVEISGAGQFPERGRPRIAFLDMSCGAAEVAKVAARLAAACKRMGVQPDDKPFRAHLTLGRAARFSRRAPDLARWIRTWTGRVAGARWRLSSVTIYRSDLQPDGSVYTPVALLSFGSPGSAAASNH